MSGKKDAIEKLLDIMMEYKTMSHEDFLQPDELRRERKRFAAMPSRETTETKMSTKKTTTKKTVATPKAAPLRKTTAAKKTTLPPKKRVSYSSIAAQEIRAENRLGMIVAAFVLVFCVGVSAGIVYSAKMLSRPDGTTNVVVPVPETLADFVARESQVLSTTERQKLIAITEQILNRHFDTPSALREEFYYQRLKAGLLDSPGFNAFWGKWVTKVTEMNPEESVESMRDIYTQLLHGLQQLKSYIDNSGEPVEGFLHKVSPSIILDASFTADADEPVTPGVLETADGRQQLIRAATGRSRMKRCNRNEVLEGGFCEPYVTHKSRSGSRNGFFWT